MDIHQGRFLLHFAGLLTLLFIHTVTPDMEAADCFIPDLISVQRGADTDMRNFHCGTYVILQYNLTAHIL